MDHKVKKPRCWCGEEATHLIQYNVEKVLILETPVCEGHKHDTYNGIKWKLVEEGTWFPDCLTLEPVPVVGA